MQCALIVFSEIHERPRDVRFLCVHLAFDFLYIFIHAYATRMIQRCGIRFLHKGRFARNSRYIDEFAEHYSSCACTVVY